MRSAILPLLLLSGVVSSCDEQVSLFDDCIAAPAGEMTVSGCTAVIDSGELTDVDLSIAYSTRGLAWSDLDEYAHAIEDIDQALRLDPEDDDLYTIRGRFYIALGESARAIKDFDHAISLEPKHVDAYIRRGIAHRALGDFERAVHDWEQSIKIGGKLRIVQWQSDLFNVGHPYVGPADGVYNAKTRKALVACAHDPACDLWGYWGY